MLSHLTGNAHRSSNTYTLGPDCRWAMPQQEMKVVGEPAAVIILETLLLLPLKIQLLACDCPLKLMFQLLAKQLSLKA